MERFLTLQGRNEGQKSEKRCAGGYASSIRSKKAIVPLCLRRLRLRVGDRLRLGLRLCLCRRRGRRCRGGRRGRVGSARR